jgi:hypothetical protein
VVLRPRGLGEIVDLACRVSSSLASRLYARLAAAALLPALALGLAMRHGLGWSWAAVWAAAACWALVAQGVFTVAMSRLLFSEEIGAGRVLALFGRRLPAYLGMLAIRGLLLGVAAATGIGLFFAWPRLVFAHEVCLLEGAGPVAALRRADRFAAPRQGTTVGILFAALGAHAAFLVTAELLGQALCDDVLQLGHPFGTLFGDGGSVFALAGFLLSAPFVATTRFLGYLDARTRADGWDVQVRFMAIAAADRARHEEVE